MTTKILVGTAGWTDKSLIDCGRFYPASAKTSEARLQHYAATFPLVEVDSTYYGLPSDRNAALWVERTPAQFTFDIKAYSVFTHHPTAVRSLPREIRERLSSSLRKRPYVYLRDLPGEILDELWERFVAALLPLDSAGKLGSILFQFPPWFLPGPDSLDYIREVKDRLPQYVPAIEFRSPTWLEDLGASTLRFLTELGLPFVCVDEPQGTRASVPPIVAATARLALVRFHGRNADAWVKPGVGVAEKYDYLYREEELLPWVSEIERLAQEADAVHVVMNNCHEDQAVRNAVDLARLLGTLRAGDRPPAQARLF